MPEWKLVIIGTGILGNSPVIIDEEFVINDKINNQLNHNSQRYDVIKDLLLVRKPGVVVDPNKLQIQREEIRNKNKRKSTSSTTKKVPKNSGNKFSIKSILKAIVLFPFKLIRWLLKTFIKDLKDNWNE